MLRAPPGSTPSPPPRPTPTFFRAMDGDRAPMASVAGSADAHGGFLVSDAAHATGVFGAHGGGLAEGFEGRENVITLHTFGKALGTEGALLCLPRVLADFLINRGRGFIFSTAPSPLIAAVGRAEVGRASCREIVCPYG